MGSGRAGCWECPTARPIDQSQRSAYKTSGREKISSVTLTYPFGRSGKVAGPSVVVVARRREERDWVIYLCRTFFVSRSSLVSSSYLLLLSGPRAISRIRETRNCEIVLFCFVFLPNFSCWDKTKKKTTTTLSFLFMLLLVGSQWSRRNTSARGLPVEKLNFLFFPRRFHCRAARHQLLSNQKRERTF